MKRTIGFFVAMACITVCILPGVISTQAPLHRGTFHAELGIQERQEAQFELNGNFRDFRNRHLIFGTVSLIDSDRAFRFQGLFTRSTFLIQSAASNRIINIIGSFTRYDEDTQTFYGQWRGFIVGYGSTRGWIEASFS